MTNLSIFQPVVSSAEFPTILGPLLDLRPLFTLVCVSKRVRELYLKLIALILKEENAASRIMRACVGELNSRRGVEPRPAYTLWCSMNASPVPNRDRFLTFNPTTSFTFVVGIPYRANPSVTCNFEVDTSTLPTDRFICVKFKNFGHILFNMRVFKFRPNAEIPAYEGEGVDPQVRTAWNYDHGAVPFNGARRRQDDRRDFAAERGLRRSASLPAWVGRPAQAAERERPPRSRIDIYTSLNNASLPPS
jgi:hypothetical protein